jgi:hypothetical protein
MAHVISEPCIDGKDTMPEDEVSAGYYRRTP